MVDILGQTYIIYLSKMVFILTFNYVVKGICMTAVLIFGLVCNSLSIYILHDKDVKLKRDFVEPLCAMSV